MRARRGAWTIPAAALSVCLGCGGTAKVEDEADTDVSDGPLDPAGDLAGDGGEDVTGDGSGDVAGDGDPVMDTAEDAVPDVVEDSGDDAEPDAPDAPADPPMDPVEEDGDAEDAAVEADAATEPDADAAGDAEPDGATDAGLDAELPEGVVGDACAGVSDCSGVPSPARECMTDILGFVELPGGYCSATCTSSTECGPGGECATILGMCLATCISSSDCREAEGYECAELPLMGGGPYCLPGSSSPEPTEDTSTDSIADAPLDTSADTLTDEPQDVPPEVEPGPGYVGDACGTDGDCDEYPSPAPTCMTDLGGFLPLPGGYCSAVDCAGDAECGSGANCVDFLGTSYCLKSCTSAAECRVSEGYDCMSLPLGAGDTYCLYL